MIYLPLFSQHTLLSNDYFFETPCKNKTSPLPRLPQVQDAELLLPQNLKK